MVALSRQPVEGAGAVRGGVLEGEYSLRPRSAPQLLDLGVEVLARRFLICVGVCVLLWFPLRLLMPFYQRMAEGQGPVPEQMTWILGTTAMLMLLQGLIDVLATTAVTLLSYQELLGRRLGVAATLRRTLRRLPALIAIFILKAVIIGFGLVLLSGVSIFCPPFLLVAFAYYLFFQWKLAVAPSALILEELGVGEAIRRSFELSRSSFLRYFGVYILAAVLGAGFSLGLTAGDYPLLWEQLVDSTGIPEPVFNGLIIVLSSVFSGVVTAINAVAITAYYLDSRIRREGLDLEMRLERLRSTLSPPGEPAG